MILSRYELKFTMTVMILLMVIILIMFMNLIFKEFYFLNKNQFFLFECGFESISWYFNNISNHFFKIGIIFITFDLELMYFLFFIFNLINMKMIWLIFNFIFFTLFLEFFLNTLSWNM
uniref:NADH dehydrogenase subunit 3 n=1 Tax=Romanomermis culicivorax TaxID=13658 RepID=A1EHF6_ROMCU|nr:NADH dehydrogenase subunit 3 [Romanomermis culicivorax]YP_913159.1 NADH dehydrogenase subunit 3 [Romanomermis culicivorax]YP_913164.1 NADH dehydrogenase subunit 3 [Romanomermis culicivorax]ABL11585.1 NADH dehydrogenase subunit 3 [Romanomermis culicivorax]ABL11586.1 NADH dehydrogenase subunit 3 [Romanomermis culicivorax]ABL11591.1 NADH dehydrogenase subunit 3 [Romanomermis culicivorax]